MKNLIPIIAVLGTVTIASGQTLYQETFGGSSTPSTLAQVGWTGAATSFSGYDGIYGQSGAVDYNTSQSLPDYAVYFGGEASASGAIFTTDSSGSGSLGTSSFSDIDPTLHSLVFTVEAQQSYQSANANNYFAVQVGGSWYASTTAMTLPITGAGANFVQESLAYNPTASDWDTFTISGSSVTVGGVAGSNLSGDITGVGILQTDVSPGGSWDFNNLEISAAPEPMPMALFTGAGSLLCLLRRRNA